MTKEELAELDRAEREYQKAQKKVYVYEPRPIKTQRQLFEDGVRFLRSKGISHL